MGLKLKASGKLALNASGKLTCLCCCTGAPTIEWDSRSASKTKCAETKPGEPNTRYLHKEFCDGNNKVTRDYTVDGVGNCTSDDTTDECYDGCFTGFFYDSGKYWRKRIKTTTCTQRFPDLPASYSSVESDTFVSAAYPTCYTSTYKLESASSSFTANPGGGPGVEATCTSTYDPETETWSGTYTVSGSPPESIDYPCDVSGLVDCTDSYTYEDEATPFGDDVYNTPYSTADLKTKTAAALPAFPGTWTGTAGSYYDLTSDELTNSIREAKYRFRFTVPSGSCYRIDWLEDGTPKTWQYTGGGTPGETAYSDEFTIPIPTTNGTDTVTDVTYSCETCA